MWRAVLQWHVRGRSVLPSRVDRMRQPVLHHRQLRQRAVCCGWRLCVRLHRVPVGQHVLWECVLLWRAELCERDVLHARAVGLRGQLLGQSVGRESVGREHVGDGGQPGLGWAGVGPSVRRVCYVVGSVWHRRLAICSCGCLLTSEALNLATY